MRMWIVTWVAAAGFGLTEGLAAQIWNSEAAITLVRQAVDRRAQTVEAAGLEDYRARADGVVLFMTQLGEGFREEPRLAQADQIVLEILWKFPNLSKQRIVGRRDRTDLPTGIRYHRDHLGIAQNSFGERIRLGDGHEVRDVRHPISRAGPEWYDYAIRDSITLEFPDGTRKLIEVAVRPVALDSAGVVGSVFLDSVTGEIVRFSFGFTKAAYIDDSVEDISVSLEHALWEDRLWLPHRQIIEIRRRASWFDFPIRGIIRASWEIGEYEFNTGVEAGVFAGTEIVDDPRRLRTFAWNHPLDSALRRFHGPIAALDVEGVREGLSELASASVLSGLPVNRIGGGGVSDLIRFNRVEGVAIGVGLTRRVAPDVELQVVGGYGFGDHRLKGRAVVSGVLGKLSLRLEAGHEVADVGEQAVSGVVNSLAAQEFGRDLGHYLLRSQGRLSVGLGDAPARVTLSIRRERIQSVAVTSGSAWGSFSPNPTFQDGEYSRGEFSFSRRARGGPGDPREVSFSVTGEVGNGPVGTYERGQLAAHLHHLNGVSRLDLVLAAGHGSGNLPAHRSFTFGGPGTLVGERFRAWGGRTILRGRAELRFAIPVPRLAIGSFITSGRVLEIGPFLGAGAAWGAVSGMPWRTSDGIRPVVGLAMEWFHRLLRIEAGYSLRDRKIRFGVDLAQEVWGIL